MKDNEPNSIINGGDMGGPAFIGNKYMACFSGFDKDFIIMNMHTGKSFTIDRTDIDAFCDWIATVQKAKEEMLP